MRSAYERVQDAQTAYEHTLAIASDADLDPEGFVALHQTGHAYAATVLNYSNAVMALLAYVETGRSDGADRTTAHQPIK